MYEQAIKYKNKLYKELARIGKGIGSDKRIEILDLLTQSPKTVDKIAKETGISIANTSRHLQILRESRLVTTTKDGNHVIYSLRSKKIAALVHLLTEIGEEELSEMKVIQDKADHLDSVKTIPLKTALKAQNDRAISLMFGPQTNTRQDLMLTA